VHTWTESLSFLNVSSSRVDLEFLSNFGEEVFRMKIAATRPMSPTVSIVKVG
jgi:hypothetical protein